MGQSHGSNVEQQPRCIEKNRFWRRLLQFLHSRHEAQSSVTDSIFNEFGRRALRLDDEDNDGFEEVDEENVGGQAGGLDDE